jgi:hypothetical protein
MDSVIICGITQLTFPMRTDCTVIIYFDTQVTPQTLFSVPELLEDIAWSLCGFYS